MSWPWDGHAYTLLPPPLQNCACLFLIRAVWEFSAQNENSRENSHHHKTAKFSISRNYAWPDVFSMGFFPFILLSENSQFYHFWLNKEKSVLFFTGCHCFSYPFNIKLKEKGTGENPLTSEVLWNYFVKIKVIVIKKCWYLTASWDVNLNWSHLLTTLALLNTLHRIELTCPDQWNQTDVARGVSNTLPRRWRSIVSHGKCLADSSEKC